MDGTIIIEKYRPRQSTINTEQNRGGAIIIEMVDTIIIEKYRPRRSTIKTGKYRGGANQSPGEIKRREVSWTLTKKLDAFAGP